MQMYKIKSFEDYHEALDDNYMKEWKRVELGCLPPKRGGRHQYFFLFWNGRKPKFTDVYENLKKKIYKDPNDFSSHSAENEFKKQIKCGYLCKTEEEIEQSKKKAKSNAHGTLNKTFDSMTMKDFVSLFKKKTQKSFLKELYLKLGNNSETVKNATKELMSNDGDMEDVERVMDTLNGFIGFYEDLRKELKNVTRFSEK